MKTAMMIPMMAAKSMMRLSFPLAPLDSSLPV